MADQILPSPDRVVTGYLRSPEGRLIPVIVEGLGDPAPGPDADEWERAAHALLTAAGAE